MSMSFKNDNNDNSNQHFSAKLPNSKPSDTTVATIFYAFIAFLCFIQVF